MKHFPKCTKQQSAPVISHRNHNDRLSSAAARLFQGTWLIAFNGAAVFGLNSERQEISHRRFMPKRAGPLRSLPVGEMSEFTLRSNRQRKGLKWQQRQKSFTKSRRDKEEETPAQQCLSCLLNRISYHQNAS